MSCSHYGKGATVDPGRFTCSYSVSLPCKARQSCDSHSVLFRRESSQKERYLGSVLPVGWPAVASHVRVISPLQMEGKRHHLNCSQRASMWSVSWLCACDSYFELTQRQSVGSKNLPERHLAEKVKYITNTGTDLVKRGLIQCKLGEVSPSFSS